MRDFVLTCKDLQVGDETGVVPFGLDERGLFPEILNGTGSWK
jgi:ribosomal protein L5